MALLSMVLAAVNLGLHFIYGFSKTEVNQLAIVSPGLWCGIWVRDWGCFKLF